MFVRVQCSLVQSSAALSSCVHVFIHMHLSCRKWQQHSHIVRLHLSQCSRSGRKYHDYVDKRQPISRVSTSWCSQCRHRKGMQPRLPACPLARLPACPFENRTLLTHSIRLLFIVMMVCKGAVFAWDETKPLLLLCTLYQVSFVASVS